MRRKSGTKETSNATRVIGKNTRKERTKKTCENCHERVEKLNKILLGSSKMKVCDSCKIMALNIGAKEYKKR